jgi:dTDP-4-dehydrorhamnose reductase
MTEEFRKVLITGSGGMLGNAVYPYFRDRYAEVLATDVNVRLPWLSHLDVTDRAEVKQVMDDFAPDLVLHLAALVDMEVCEEQAERAQLLNADATQIVAEAAARHGATTVYISTAGVFDGQTETYYTEADAPNPICVYGETKFGGEVHVRNICAKHYVLRPGWMVGGGEGLDRKFVAMILDQLRNGQTVIHAVDDKQGTPTYTYDLAANLHALLQAGGDYGDYHMVCQGSGTRYEVAKEILAVCRRDDVELKAVKSDFFAKRFFAPRPRTEILVNQRLIDMGINLMRPWQEAIQEYIPRQYPGYIRARETV